MCWSSHQTSDPQEMVVQINFEYVSLNSIDDSFPHRGLKKKEGCAVSELSWCELIGKTSLSFLFLLGLEFLEPHRFTIRTISNIVRHIFILNLWDRKFPQTYFISVAMAQEISRTKHWFLTFAVKIFLPPSSPSYFVLLARYGYSERDSSWMAFDAHR